MAKLPPQPVGVAPGSSYWNDWYEKLRTFVEQITTSVDWAIITGKPTTLAGYGITDAQTKLNNSADLAASLGDETGTGVVVFNNSPTLINPVLGTPASVTLTNGTGLPITGVTGMGAGVLAFLATPSSGNLAAAVTGETGTGALVFGTSPTFTTSIGVNMAPVALIQANAGSADGLAPSWNLNYTVTSFGATSTSPGVGISYDNAAGAGNISFLHPGVAWRAGRYRASQHEFYTNGSTLGATLNGTGLSVVGSITTSDGRLHTTTVALTNAAGAAVATLNNAPVAGNPTKWIEINDNGTIRRIPTW